MRMLRKEDCKRQKALLVLRERNRLEVLEVTKRKISIKTIDGGRFDFSVKRMFMLKNIVSITDKETENE